MGRMGVWDLMRFQQLREFCVTMGEVKSLAMVLTYSQREILRFAQNDSAERRVCFILEIVFR
jgi:hypothetical protein